MTRIKIIPIIILIALALSPLQPLFPKDGPGMGARYLKLGNTYREARQFEMAADYLNKGKSMVERDKSWKGRYWTAVCYEYYGYLFRDVGMKDEAKEYFTLAINIFKKIIKMKDGSQAAVESAMKSIDALKGQIGNMDSWEGPASGVLNMDNQKLKELPGDIPSALENLSLADNRFKTFPSGLMEFKNLKYLNLAGNRIKSIPGNISQLGALTWLDLSGNRLKELPAGLCNMKSLSILDLSNNKLKTLPAGMCMMKNLKILNLKNNKISFEILANAIKCLPNTNVLFDEYILKPDTEEEDFEVVE